jgi:glycyl-tRNA synthetase
VQSSEIYGRLSGQYEYGPLGAQVKRCLSDLWWRSFVSSRRNCIGLDSAVIQHPSVWKTAGHVQHFVDPLVECRSCHQRHRPDQLLDQHGLQSPPPPTPPSSAAAPSSSQTYFDELQQLLTAHRIPCPSCSAVGSFTPPQTFNLLFTTTHASSTTAYLRPETAQAIFTSFPSLLFSSRQRLPFGVGQVGRSFRNEINCGQWLFRMREFEQAELEFFCRPEEAERWHAYWTQQCLQWLERDVGLDMTKVRLRQVAKADLAFYAVACTDIEYRFPHGWGELWGIANRGDYDLRVHQQATGRSLQYTDPSAPAPSAPFFPFVIEPALGLDRLFYALLDSGWQSDVMAGQRRAVLRWKDSICPYEFAVFPLMKKDEMVRQAGEIWDALLAAGRRVCYDAAGSIGRRYRRQDEIGTPRCVTVDGQTLEDKTVTVRDRDSGNQLRVSIDELLQIDASRR